MEDQERLVRRFQEGDAGAFEILFRNESPRLGRFVRRYFRADDVAEDVFQETWLRAWNRREALREPERFTSWLYQIGRNTILEEFRRRKRRPEVTIYGDPDNPDDPAGAVARIADSGPDPRATAVRGQLAAAIEVEILRLDDQAREMLALRFGAGLGLREISEVLEVPIGTVCAKVSRSLKSVKDSMNRKGISWEP